MTNTCHGELYRVICLSQLKNGTVLYSHPAQLYLLSQQAVNNHFKYAVLDCPGPHVVAVSFVGPESQLNQIDAHYAQLLRSVKSMDGDASATRAQLFEPKTPEETFHAIQTAVRASDWDGFVHLLHSTTVGHKNGWFLRGTSIAIVASWLVCHGSAMAGDWPMYRGPNHNGVSEEVDWISEWGEEGPKVLWRVSVGFGSSAVVIADGRAYTMGNHGQEEDQQQDTVYCFDAVTGETLWKHTYPCPQLPKYYEGRTLATPTVDGKVVYSVSKMGDLVCLDARGGQGQ